MPPLPTPTAQPGLMAYYQFDNLINKQGNTTFNGVLNGAANINATNTSCNFEADSCNIVTPVTITSFSATAVNQSFKLNWHTEQEYNIVKYVVQRSVSGNEFIDIGTVNAGIGAVNNNYSFIDNDVKPGITYFYRLLIKENGGQTAYSIVKNGRISGQGLYSSISPNPTTGDVTLQINNYSGLLNITIFNNLGEAIQQKKTVVHNYFSINLPLFSQPKGTYWVRLQSEKENMIKKIIKE